LPGVLSSSIIAENLVMEDFPIPAGRGAFAASDVAASASVAAR
jgi:hypothetical protein